MRAMIIMYRSDVNDIIRDIKHKGRKNGIKNGYRPNCQTMQDVNIQCNCQFTDLPDGELKLGKYCECTIIPIKENIKLGCFYIREGATIVGTGKIVKNK